MRSVAQSLLVVGSPALLHCACASVREGINLSVWIRRAEIDRTAVKWGRTVTVSLKSVFVMEGA